MSFTKISWDSFTFQEIKSNYQVYGFIWKRYYKICFTIVCLHLRKTHNFCKALKAIIKIYLYELFTKT